MLNGGGGLGALYCLYCVFVLFRLCIFILICSWRKENCHRVKT